MDDTQTTNEIAEKDIDKSENKEEYTVTGELTFRKYRLSLVAEDTSGKLYDDKVTGAEAVYRIAADELRMDMFPNEAFAVIALDAKHKPTGVSIVSQGGLSSTLIEPRQVFAFLISANAAFSILVHNHPSGDLTPSKLDTETTKRLVSAGEIMGIPIIDHVIVGPTGSGYLSFRSEGLI
jgi:DNA repair protein RadC